LLKFPAKTAHVEGTVVDAATGKPLRFISISVQSPAYGIYECSQEPSADGTPPPKPMPAEGGADDGSVGIAIAPSPPDYDNGCAIAVSPDGTFRGNVTPGYAIVQAYHDSYRDCPQAPDSPYVPCMTEYYGWTQSLRLAADGTTRITIAMQQRPAPDAVVSGYLLDEANGQPIAGGQVSFSNEDAYGYGAATTDQDGSYRIRLRSGHLTVYAHAEGHLHWQGTLDAKAGETPLDIRLPAGEEASGGGCCFAYGGKGVMAIDAAPAMGGSGGSNAHGSAIPESTNGDRSGTANSYQDLHGGLGPYDASARARALEKASGQSSPGAGLLVLVALLGCAAWLRRR
ncbi:MAG: carboxypeptidase-like regulatory domain-containing protein, partial [Halobacteriales archaeon]|nr:carboxypeptidase-like regulatory domain-containing protein [Halobacteriales archaeon]